MEAVDYFVLLMVLAAYLGWIFQGERNYKPHVPKTED